MFIGMEGVGKAKRKKGKEQKKKRGKGEKRRKERGKEGP